jgi:hypothetical protein
MDAMRALLFGAVGVLLGIRFGHAMKRRWRRPLPHPHRRELSARVAESLVDEAGNDSFPASDPPAWTLGREPE